ncbi:hypothetical protein FRC06_007891, partial [Ceratobasidium sp. 370]
MSKFVPGKSIKYYGDKDPKGGSASVRVDGQTAATQMLWASPPLDSYDLQIVISNVGAKVNPQQGIIGLCQTTGRTVFGMSIDGGAPENVNTATASPLLSVSLSRTSSEFIEILGCWVADAVGGGLSDAPHTITITHAGSPGSAGSVDFFNSGAGASSASPSATAAASTDSSTSSGTPKSAPAGAIVGGSVGGLAVLAAIAFIELLFVRKRAKHDQTPSPANDNGKEAA